jgi:hypothetical protein
MAKQVQLRRGTTAELSSVTGAEGEVIVDTTKDTLTLHDAYTAGGIPMLREDLDNLAAASVGIDKLSIGSATAGQALKVNDAGTALEFGTGGRIISYNNYRFTGIYQAPNTTAETTYWSVQFNRTRSDSKIWVVSDVPAFELPNGVWVGVALNVNGFKVSRGLKHFRPSGDTTCVGFNSLISASEVGSTTGNITIGHFYNWGGANDNVRPFNYLNFKGGSGSPGNTDPRISSSLQTEGHMMVMEIV